MTDWHLRETTHRAGTKLEANYAYFDTAAAAPPFERAAEAATEYLQQTLRTGPYLPSLRSSVYERVDSIREAVARFLQATPAEIAFTRNGTESISLVARGLEWNVGDEIIVPDTEMLSNVVIWRMLEQEYGVRVVTVAADPSGLLSAERIEAAMTDRTRLITFAALSNVTGAVQPVRDICELANGRGVLTHINASQALGIMPAGFEVWQCDFISACTRKGLRGIEGSGVLAVKREHIEALRPTLAGWWNGSYDPETGSVTFPSTAKRFESGGPNIPAILALGAAIDTVEGLGIEVIYERVCELTTYTATRLRNIEGAEVYGPDRDADRLGILPFNLARIDAQALTLALERRGIIIEAGHFMAAPILSRYGIERMARISLHSFNTHEEVDRLIAALSECAEQGV